MSKGSEIVHAPPPRPPATQHHSFEEVMRMAETVANAGLFPGVTSPQAAFTLMMTCQAEGLHPMTAMKRYHIIKGRISMRADAMLAEYQARGGRVEWLRTDEEVCEAHWSHPIFNPKGKTLKLTLKRFMDSGVAMCWDEKKRCMVLKDNWKNFPDAMLRARMTSAGVRLIDPGSIAGTYTPEEVMDFKPGDLESFEADAVAEDSAKPIDVSFVEKPILPALPPKVDNESGYKTGKYASPEQVEEYRRAVKAFLDDANARWADEWTTDEGMTEGIKDVVNAIQMTRHLLKWALREQKLAPIGMTWDAETGKPTEKSSIEQDKKLVAIVHAREPEAVATEMEIYFREMCDLARAEWRKQHDMGEDEFLMSTEGGREG